MSQKLRIPSHYYVYSDPPDAGGEETLHFASAQRRVRLRGHSFREFVQRVVPLLDGSRTVEQVQREVGDLFAPEDLNACLEMLGRQGLLEDPALSPVPPELADMLSAQMNFFRDLSSGPEEIQRQIMRSTISVFGLSGVGASCAAGLASAGVGFLNCVDGGAVSPADRYCSPVFAADDHDILRIDVVARHVEAIAPNIRVTKHSDRLESDEEVRRVIEGSDFVVNCLDEGEIGLAYKINRACIALGIMFTTVQASGAEVILGPTVEPRHTACFLCYKMRSVACADNPEAEFAFQSFLDRRHHDDSPRRANLAFGVSIAASLAGIEALKSIVALPSATARGRVYVLNLLDMTCQTHLVLRKPWCPACFADWDSRNL